MDNVNFVIRSLDEKKIFTNCEMCKFCNDGTRCCESSGCAYSPEDFYVLQHNFSKEDQVKYLKHFIKRGYVSIDHKCLTNMHGAADIIKLTRDLNYDCISYEKLLAGEGALYLRVRNVRQPIVDFLSLEEIEGPCILWSPERGCPLSYNKRPKSGRLLRPKMTPDGDCIQAYTELQAAIDWYPYQDILYQLYKIFI